MDSCQLQIGVPVSKESCHTSMAFLEKGVVDGTDTWMERCRHSNCSVM
jgi:hypothetical protein